MEPAAVYVEVPFCGIRDGLKIPEWIGEIF